MKLEYKYLYAASVQGIQEFIFRTNTLKEILGASEMVEQICTNKFAEHLGKSFADLEEDPNAIVFAAGNIKYIFDNEKTCKNFAKSFPYKIATFAPGITMSQAVVKYVEESPANEKVTDEQKSQEGQNNIIIGYKNAVMEVEKKLKIQRNKPLRNLNIGYMGIERCRQTGLPCVVNPNLNSDTKSDYKDEATYNKLSRVAAQNSSLCTNAFGDNANPKDIPFDTEEITTDNNWIALVHADGNGLGSVIMKIGQNKEEFKKFSRDLDKATKAAVQGAYKEVCEKEEKNPIRPIVLSGDDLTFICRADIALPFTAKFLELFEAKTKELLGEILEENRIFIEGNVKDSLTACAGIAFIKAKFPFYAAYTLAEDLCGQAKKNAKDTDAIRRGEALPKSCIMFHKVQDSFITKYEDNANRELNPPGGYTFKSGPYYLRKKKGKWTIQDLEETVGKISGNDNSLSGNIRNWMSLLYHNPEMAKQRLDRIESNLSEENRKLLKKIVCRLEKDNIKISPAYDILTIKSMNTKITEEAQ